MSEPRKTRSELKREAIIQAARQAFLEDGVRETSMDRLAELAQVSKRTVYNHFATKEALVMFLITDLWNRAMVQREFPFDPDMALDAQLANLLSDEIRLVSSREYLELTRVAFGYFFYQPEELRREVEKFSGQETIVHRWLRDAVDNGALRELDVKTAASQLHSLIKGACFWPQLMQMQSPLSEAEEKTLAENTTALFLSHYRRDNQ